MVWAFVFTMPEGSWQDVPEAAEDEVDPGSFFSPSTWLTTEEVEAPDLSSDMDGQFTQDPGTRNAEKTLRISHEAWLCAEQILASDLTFRHVIPIDGRHLILAVGACHDILVDEAANQSMLMRCQETKGALAFHPDLLRFYASNHGGLNEFNEGNWNRRQLEDADDHWKADDQLSELQLLARRSAEKRIFTSAQAQRLVMSRLRRLGRYFPDRMTKFGSQNDPDQQLLSDLTKRSVVKYKPINGTMLENALLAFGGFRPQNHAVFPDARNVPIIHNLAKLIVLDDQFNLTPQDGMKSLKMIPPDLELTYEHVSDLVGILDKWKAGKGREEVWFGTLKSYFPLHVESELKYLKAEWGSPKVLFRRVIIGYSPESQPRVYDEGPPKQMEMNTFGSSGNLLHEHAFPMSVTYQPLEEIRDYFGDDLGLYFSWIGLYTRMLTVCSIFGIFVMMAQPFYGGVEKNPFTLAYSIYVGLWSISFLETWTRRENELRFLWGTASLSTIEQPRPPFIGVLETHIETGRQMMVQKSSVKYSLKMGASYLVCFCFIILTIFSALAAQLVRYIDAKNDQSQSCKQIDCSILAASGAVLTDDCNATGTLPTMGTTGGWEPHLGSESWAMGGDLDMTSSEGFTPCTTLQRKRWELCSAALNLVIIGSYGVIFEALADYLAEWENHRLESEFENSRVRLCAT